MKAGTWAHGLSLRFKIEMLLVLLAGLALCARAQIRAGGIDPHNLGKGVWIYSMTDATNRLGGHIAGVTNENSLMRFYRSTGVRYCIVKAATGDKLFAGCNPGPQFTSNLVTIAHANGVLILGYNRSFGSNILGEIAMADYVFQQGADGFVFDAEIEWETGNAWITNGPAQAWWLCSTVRAHWPNKFLAHSPFPIIAAHNTFPYKEFGFWCDAVMPQIYHFSSAGIKGSASAAINWTDVNWAAWQKSLYALPVTNISGVTVNWTNAIKPLILLRDVYGPVISGGNICEDPEDAIYPARDVTEFMDYGAADPHAQTVGGYRGINFWRADTMASNQWANIAGGTTGRYSNIVNHLVMDDPAAQVIGGWNPVRVFGATTTTATYYGATGSDTNSFGTNYLFKSHGDGSAYVQFTPDILIPGKYDVYQWHPFLTNASMAVPFVIGTPGGTNQVWVNQQTNDGNWSWLGRFDFAAGRSNFIRVLDSFSDITNVAVADGVKLVYATTDIVLDNTNPEVNFDGSWSLGNSAVGRYQADYRYASSAASTTAAAIYRPDFPNAGLYQVSIWYPSGSNRATNAPWTITFSNGITNFTVNQQANGGDWFQLAEALPFNRGTNGFIRLENHAGPSVVLADAVKFSFAGPWSLPFLAIAHGVDGGTRLIVNSTPGYALQIDWAEDLSNWQPLTNLLNSEGTFIVTDDSAAGHAAGFYRIHP